MKIFGEDGILETMKTERAKRRALRGFARLFKMTRKVKADCDAAGVDMDEILGDIEHQCGMDGQDAVPDRSEATVKKEEPEDTDTESWLVMEDGTEEAHTICPACRTGYMLNGKKLDLRPMSYCPGCGKKLR